MKWLFALLIVTSHALGGTLTLGTYNLELYSDTPVFNEPAKSEVAKRIIRQGIKELNAGVLALQEVSSTNALLDLREQLKREGTDYPYWEFTQGPDTNLHLAFLSRYPIVRRQPYINENFLYQGRRFHVSRGFSEIEVEVAPGFRCTLITAHLKSKRISFEADQQGLREEEATLLREKIDQFLKRSPHGNLIVLGDFNDGIDTKTIKTILGRGKARLFDTRPAERVGDTMDNPNPRYEPRRILWTHYFGRDETYSRIDYILTSQSLRSRYKPEQSFIPVIANWGMGSDHRPICATFETP